MEWSNDVTLAFIGDVEKLGVLWDTKSPYYKLARRKNHAWASLARAYKSTPDEVKRKWQSLQASFRRELAKDLSKTVVEASDVYYNSNWFAYPAMRFLAHRYKARKTTDTSKTIPKSSNGQFSVCWDDFHKSISTGMNSLLASEHLLDVTLAIDGQYLKAHKFVLSVCSPYFRTLFSTNPCRHPIIFMKDVNYEIMNDLLTFMYQGEVKVHQENLAMFIKTAEALQIKGLSHDNNSVNDVLQGNKTKRLASEEASKPKSRKQPVEQPTKKQKISLPNDQTKIVSSSIDQSLAGAQTKPLIVSTTNIMNDCVDIKTEPDDTNPEEVNDNNFDDSQVVEYVERGLDEDKDYIVEGQEGTQVGTSGDFTMNIINDCVDLKIESCNSSSEDDNRFDDDEVVQYYDQGLESGKDTCIEGEKVAQAGTSGDGLSVSQESVARIFIDQYQPVGSVEQMIRRMDRIDHMVEKMQQRSRCGQCGIKTEFGCKKCQVTLHPKCFLDYHNGVPRDKAKVKKAQ